MNWLSQLIASLDEGAEEAPIWHEGIERAVNQDELPVLLLKEADNLWPNVTGEAYKKYIQAIKSARVIGKWEYELALYYRLVQRLLEENQYPEVVELSRIATMRAKGHEDWDEAAKCVQWAVIAFFKDKKTLKMMPMLKDAVLFLDKIKNPELALDVLDNYIAICHISGMFEEVVKFSDEYKSLAGQVNNQTREMEMLERLVVSYIGLAQFENAKAIAQEELRVASAHDSTNIKVSALNLLSKAEVALGNHEAALITENEALSLARTINDDELELDCLAQSAQIRLSMGLAYEGTEIAAEGLRLSIQKEKNNFIPHFLALLKNNGEMTDETWFELQRLADQALLAIRTEGNPHQIADCLSNLGSFYREKDPQKSIEYYRELEKHYEDEANVLMRIGLCRSLAEAYQNLGVYSEAAAQLEYALTLFYRNRLPFQLQYFMILLELSEIYLRSHDLSKSFDLVSTIDKVVGDDNPEKISWAFAFLLSQHRGNLYKAKKEYHAAEDAYKEALFLLNSRFYLAASADIRSSIQDAIRKLSQYLLTVCLKQTKLLSEDLPAGQRALHYAELARSRQLLAQLGRTFILPPSSIPISLLEEEKACLKSLQKYYATFRNSNETTSISAQLASWERLRKIWDDMKLQSSETQQYIALRRGDASGYHAITECLEINSD